jgi:glutamate racemase
MRVATHQTAVIDWGIGGLSVYRAIKRKDPGRTIVYLSDSGATPYGKMSSRELEARLTRICEHFMAEGIQEIVVACNAGSTVAPRLRRRYAGTGLRLVDVISCGIRMVQRTSLPRLGVIGGERTIRSQIYQRELSTGTRQVVGRIAQPLSALIERGELDSPLMHRTLSAILAPMRRMDGLLLACTHYPAVQSHIQRLVPGCHIFDPAASTAEELVGGRKTVGEGGPDHFLTTGDPLRSRKVAEAAFGVQVDRFIGLDLSLTPKKSADHGFSSTRVRKTIAF